jgi:hypothetical protein
MLDSNKIMLEEKQEFNKKRKLWKFPTAKDELIQVCF